LERFNRIIKKYYRTHGRHDLPWRKTRDPYKILISEIMLQQTQVARVEGFYKKFLKQFPDFKALAKADTTSVLKAWQGLGYNRRALALKKTAEIVVREYGGKLPANREELEKLPGIGRGTSGSLMAFAFNKPEIFIETNIRRVFIRLFFLHARKAVTDAAIERYIECTIDKKYPREWYWALMDYGAAMVKKGNNDEIFKNPNQKSAHYKRQSVFKGSDREARGKILRYLLMRSAQTEKITKTTRASVQKAASIDDVSKAISVSGERLEKIISHLGEEGFIIRKGSFIRIK
jgi:A/G-specific adenine glycosylase